MNETFLPCSRSMVLRHAATVTRTRAAHRLLTLRRAASMPLTDGGPTAAVAAAHLPTGLAVLTLARPSKLNALDTSAVEALLSLTRGLRSPRTAGAGGVPTPPARALLLRGAPAAGGRAALCAGGDVLAIRNAVRAAAAADATETASPGLGVWPAPPLGHAAERVFQSEYTLLTELAGQDAPPAIVLMDGIVMGLGAGLAAASGAGAPGGGIRIATERTLWAMPEQAIGLFPDVGFALWGAGSMTRRAVLALGLCGGRVVGGCVAVRCGLATHALPSSELPALEDELRRVDLTPCASPADVAAALREVVDTATARAPLPPPPAARRLRGNSG